MGLDQLFKSPQMIPFIRSRKWALPAASRAASAAVRSPRKILGVFTHQRRSASVCLSLWPQHKQLHPQINRRGPTSAAGRSSARLQEALGQRAQGPPLFVRSIVFTCTCEWLACATGSGCLRSVAWLAAVCLLMSSLKSLIILSYISRYNQICFFFFPNVIAQKANLLPPLTRSPAHHSRSWTSGGGAGTRDRERDSEREGKHTKLADTGHNLISTVGGQLCSVICHGSPFRLQWLAWPAKENWNCSEPPLREGGGDRATIYGLVLKKHTPLTCYW